MSMLQLALFVLIIAFQIVKNVQPKILLDVQLVKLDSQKIAKELVSVQLQSITPTLLLTLVLIYYQFSYLL